MKINQYIDHTLLKPTATKSDIITLCKEAVEYQFYSVCVNGCYVKLASDYLKEYEVKVVAVVGFPLGGMSTFSKIFEAKSCVLQGATEIDMVINIGKLLDEDYDYVQQEIASIKDAIGDAILKVIIETCYLSKSQIIKVSELVINAGADFVKTSTGFGTGGATLEDVKLMKETVKDTIQIKASGGIKDYETAVKYIQLGATRLGTSSGVSLVTKGTSNKNSY